MGGATVSGSPARRPLLWWDLAAALMLAVLTALALFMAQDAAPRWAAGASAAAHQALMLAPLAAFALVYAALGRRALLRAVEDEPIGAAGPMVLILLMLVVAWAVFTEPINALLQALVYPIVWTVSQRYRDAVLWSAAVALGVGTAMFAGIATVDPGSGLFSAVSSGPLSFVFAVAMGTWITRIFAQGERHRETAEQLRRSQAEVAALSGAAGAAAERERLSRELHDTLTQTLTGLVMLSEQAERALDAGDQVRAKDRLGRVSSAAREAVAEARALVATTQPLADGGLAASIDRVAARLRVDTELQVACDLDPVPLEREREVVLLRAAQEGLANARRHARAASVRVTLTGLPEGGARLLIEDDGVGPDATAQGPAGFGLSGLVERVRSVGGEVRFGPGDAGGARLEVRLPVAEPPEDAELGSGLPPAGTHRNPALVARSTDGLQRTTGPGSSAGEERGDG